MMISYKNILTAFFLIVTSCTAIGKNLVYYVNPFIGTDYTGNTYPGAQVPFGMVQLSPDNGLPGWDRIAGYFYPDSTIAGFSHTHLSGTGAGDLYDISFMPVTLPYKEAEGDLGIYSRFSHQDESAYAGYYQVRLTDYNINVELTATPRCGIQRYTFPKAKSGIYLNLKKAMNWDKTVDSYIELVDAYTIRGYRFSDGWARNQKVYFVTRFSKPFKEATTFKEPLQGEQGTGYIARFDFDTEEGEQIVVSTAISAVSMEGAMKNLLYEAPHNNFDKYLSLATKAWEKELSKIQIKSKDFDKLTVFYTSFYRSMLAPTLFKDVDGQYYGADFNVYHALGWNNYTTFSLWDTYRAAHPLLSLTHPKESRDMVLSLIEFGKQKGRLPVWSLHGSETDMMLGYHSVPVIVSLLLKEKGGYSTREILNLCLKTANYDTYRNIGDYKKFGYVPYDITDPYNSDNWALSKTLEYAYDDYCIALLAEKLGEKEVAETFYKRAQNYQNLFNKNTGFFQPKDSNGEFIEPFDPEEYTPYIAESNAWQYLWSVQHDIDGLMKLLGGKEQMAIRLDQMFTTAPTDSTQLPIFSTGVIGQYAHGNEPGHHIPYLYNAVRQPWKTAEYINKICTELYKNTPSGLCGNEDCGQMSAWYVFSSMGFYPVNPVSNEYEIGTPQFESMTLNLPNGKKFTVLAHGLSNDHIFISRAFFNGKRHRKSTLTYEEIQQGGTLELFMTDRSGICWY